MADALASGASVRKDVGVQVPPRPQREIECALSGLNGFFCVTLIAGTKDHNSTLLKRVGGQAREKTLDYSR